VKNIYTGNIHVIIESLCYTFIRISNFFMNSINFYVINYHLYSMASDHKSTTIICTYYNIIMIINIFCYNRMIGKTLPCMFCFKSFLECYDLPILLTCYKEEVYFCRCIIYPDHISKFNRE
jgi:hypothetical protein